MEKNPGFYENVDDGCAEGPLLLLAFNTVDHPNLDPEFHRGKCFWMPKTRQNVMTGDEISYVHSGVCLFVIKQCKQSNFFGVKTEIKTKMVKVFMSICPSLLLLSAQF